MFPPTSGDTTYIYLTTQNVKNMLRFSEDVGYTVVWLNETECFSKLPFIGSDNGLSPDRIWLIRTLGTHLMKSWSQFIQFHTKNAFENVICEMAVILSRPQCVNSMRWVEHIHASKLGYRWSRWWFVAFSRRSHLNQWWLIVYWIHENKFQWNFNQHAAGFIQKILIWKCRLWHFVLASNVLQLMNQAVWMSHIEWFTVAIKYIHFKPYTAVTQYVVYGYKWSTLPF